MKEAFIQVKVSAGAKTENVEEIERNVFKVKVCEAPEKGRANKRVARILAEYFNIPKRNVSLVRGATYKEKTFSVELE